MRRSLSRGVAANLINGLVSIGVALVYVPVILDGVGLAAFGVWTLAQTALVYVTTAEAGVGPAIQRFVAVADGAHDRLRVVRLLWTTAGLYAIGGLVVAGLAYVVAPGFVDLFNVSSRLRPDAIDMFRLVGVAMLLALLAAGLGNVQQGLERFVAFGVTNAIAALAFLAALVALLGSSGRLTDVGLAAIVQQGTLVLARVVSLRDVLAAARPGLVAMQHAKEIVSFSLRLQMSVLSSIVNNQTDKVVIGLVSTTRVVGQAGIASQVADSSRLLAGAALGPMVSRMSQVHGAGDQKGLVTLFGRVNRLWSMAVIGITVIGAASIYPVIAGWLGAGHGIAARLGALLIVAYGFNMLTGAGTSYLRAIGTPGLEARYGALLIGLNVALTPPLGVLFGPTGVVAATTATYAAGTAWFLWRLQRAHPALPHEPVGAAARALLVALPAGAASAAWGLLVIGVVPAGLALVPVLLGAGAALVLYLSLMTATVPTPGNVRALLRDYASRP
jgi:O-antigen/teichoic acid export membrane protein